MQNFTQRKQKNVQNAGVQSFIGETVSGLFTEIGVGVRREDSSMTSIHPY